MFFFGVQEKVSDESKKYNSDRRKWKNEVVHDDLEVCDGLKELVRVLFDSNGSMRRSYDVLKCKAATQGERPGVALEAKLYLKKFVDDLHLKTMRNHWPFVSV